MFVPEGNDAALPMMFLLWFAWGSWPSARKQGGCDNVNFALTFIFVQVLVSLFMCFTMGMMSLKDTRHFDEEMFHHKFIREVQEKTGGILVSWIAGVLLCAGDFLMACAIDLLGLAVACPVGFGLALTYGTAVSYILEPRSDPALLFPGLACCLVGMICDAASHQTSAKGPSPESIPKVDTSGIPEPIKVDTMAVCTRQSQGLARKTGTGLECCLAGMICHPIFGAKSGGHPDLNLREVADPAKVDMPNGIELDCVDEYSEKKPLNRCIFFLPLAGGLFCGSHGPISTAAATLLDLSPFSLLLVFMIGQLCMIFPLVLIYTWVTISWYQDLPFQAIPSFIWRGYISSLSNKKAHLWNSVAGINVGMGYFFYFVGSPVVSRAVGFIFGCSSSPAFLWISPGASWNYLPSEGPLLDWHPLVSLSYGFDVCSITQTGD